MKLKFNFIILKILNYNYFCKIKVIEFFYGFIEIIIIILLIIILHINFFRLNLKDGKFF